MSTATSILPPGYAFLDQDRQPLSRKWILWACLAHIGLLVPQVTGFLQWGSRQGLMPVPPAVYVGAMSLLNIMLLLPRKPFTSHTSLIVILLCIWRLLDALTQRYGPPDSFAASTTRISVTLGFALLSILISGVAVRDHALPLCSAATVSILVSTGANLAELAGMIKNSSVPGRAAGFIPDANDSAIAIICMLALLLTLQRHFWFSTAMIAIALIGVIPTLSRSGFMILSIVILTFFAQNIRRHSGKILASIGLFIALGIVAVAIISTSSNLRNDVNVQERLGAIFGGNTSKLESSERMKDFNDGLEGAMLRPLFGHGIGSGSGGTLPEQWRPHNQLVSIWIELGLIGAGVYLLIVLIMLWKCLTAPSAALLCSIPVIAFLPFSQTLADTAAYWLLAMVAALRSSSRPVQFKLWRQAPPTLPHPYGLTS